MGKERWMWLLPHLGQRPGWRWRPLAVRRVQMGGDGRGRARRMQGAAAAAAPCGGGGGGRIASEIEDGRLLGATQSDTSDGE